MPLADSQYKAIELIYLDLRARSEDRCVDEDELIRAIEADPNIARIAFPWDSKQAYERYKRGVIAWFAQEWYQRRAEHIVARINRTYRIKPMEDETTDDDRSVQYCPIDGAWQDIVLADSVKRYYQHGLAEIRKHAPYCESWGQSVENLIAELDGLKAEIINKCELRKA